MAVAFIHIFLSQVMQNAYNYKGYSNDWNLIMAPVNYRVNACGFGGEDGSGVTGAPVEAEGGCYSSGCGQTAYAQAQQDGEHGYHQQHCQTGGTVDAQTDEHADNPSAAHYQIGGF